MSGTYGLCIMQKILRPLPLTQIVRACLIDSACSLVSASVPMSGMLTCISGKSSGSGHP